ncbi:hypothetical protein J7K25_04725 [bacterium]|nr:hypothetical protein [bacterium]
MKKSIFSLGNNTIYVEAVEVQFYPDFTKQEYEIKMLSPVTDYSTLKSKNGKKKTYYYSPTEKEFNCFIKENLKEIFFNLSKEGRNKQF